MSKKKKPRKEQLAMADYRVNWIPNDGIDAQRLVLFINASAGTQNFDGSVSFYDFEAAPGDSILAILFSQEGAVWGASPPVASLSVPGGGGSGSGSGGGGGSVPEAASLSIDPR